MMEYLQTVGIAGVMFAATNADDLVLLCIFFAQPGCRPWSIVAGQLLGIGALTAISLTASELALAVPHGWLPVLGLVPLWIGVRWTRRKQTTDHVSESMALWAIAGVTMANGADNLGVYIPAFAMQTSMEKVLTGATFGILTLVWCSIASWAVTHPAWAPRVSHACGKAAPFVLIGIGLWILAHHPIFGMVAIP